MSSHIAPLRGVGSTTPTVRLERPCICASTPDGWRSSPKADGSTEWTWSDSGAPIVSVMVGRGGGVAPVFARDPEHYWMRGDLFARAARALASLAAHLESGR